MLDVEGVHNFGSFDHDNSLRFVLILGLEIGKSLLNIEFQLNFLHQDCLALIFAQRIRDWLNEKSHIFIILLHSLGNCRV